MKVILLTYTPTPTQTIAAAGRLCYSDTDIEPLREKIAVSDADAFVHRLDTMGHESPIEHVSFTFGIEGVSRSFLAQITRHRLASFSVQSQRYVRQTNFHFVTPPAIADDPKLDALYQEQMQRAIETYNTLADALAEKYNGDEKRAIEDARFVLPEATTTKMIVTMNARELRHFFALRCCARAQWEIREVAYAMYRLAYAASPAIFEKAGPPCMRGNCPEGKMSCGKPDEIREKIHQLQESSLS